MSEQYSEYIKSHRHNVAKAFDWLANNTPEIFDDEQFKSDCMWQCVQNHDSSKFDDDEYKAYDAYFYGGNRSYQVVQDFNRAWLLHIHKNPHHWQYWILRNDNPDEGEIILDMPNIYIIEMICDWWSFSWKKGDLYEIFNWYEERKEYIKLSDSTRVKVEGLLNLIRTKLDKSDVSE